MMDFTVQAPVRSLTGTDPSGTYGCTYRLWKCKTDQSVLQRSCTVYLFIQRTGSVRSWFCWCSLLSRRTLCRQWPGNEKRDENCSPHYHCRINFVIYKGDLRALGFFACFVRKPNSKPASLAALTNLWIFCGSFPLRSPLYSTPDETSTPSG